MQVKNMKKLIVAMRERASHAGVGSIVLVAQPDGVVQPRTMEEAQTVFQNFPGLVIGTYRVKTAIPVLSQLIREDLGE